MKYGRFIEIKGGTAVDDLNFLVKARSDDETRPFLQYMHVEEGEEELIGVCTDGRRMHVLSELHPILIDLGIDEGLWHVVKAQKNCVQLAKLEDAGLLFPNWKKIIPQEKPSVSLEFGGVDFKKIKKAEYSQRLTKLLRTFPEMTPINLQFLTDLGVGYRYNVGWYAHNKVVTFVSGNREAYLMPLATEDID